MWVFSLICPWAWRQLRQHRQKNFELFNHTEVTWKGKMLCDFCMCTDGLRGEGFWFPQDSSLCLTARCHICKSFYKSWPSSLKEISWMPSSSLASTHCGFGLILIDTWHLRAGGLIIWHAAGGAGGTGLAAASPQPCTFTQTWASRQFHTMETWNWKWFDGWQSYSVVFSQNRSSPTAALEMGKSILTPDQTLGYSQEVSLHGQLPVCVSSHARGQLSCRFIFFLAEVLLQSQTPPECCCLQFWAPHNAWWWREACPHHSPLHPGDMPHPPPHSCQ